jgi:hypothetical protein
MLSYLEIVRCVQTVKYLPIDGVVFPPTAHCPLPIE